MDFYQNHLSTNVLTNIDNVYKFDSIKKAKKAILSKNKNAKIIDMGVGEPDIPAHNSICSILKEECIKSENRFYTDNGIEEFKIAAANYLKNIYDLTNIDPSVNIAHGIGSKSILAMLPLCFINQGDITLTTVPGYPVLGTHTKFLGGHTYNLPLYKENDFYPDLTNIPSSVLKKSKLLYINYPNNPTGQIATPDFYKRVVEFAHKHQIIVISDSAYSPLTFDENPLSFLSIDGAREIGVEIHSLSKAFNMTGWRIAFIAGDEKFINTYKFIKSHIDSGQFCAIQKAATYALNNPNLVQENIIRYKRRLHMLSHTLNEIGFDTKMPKATFYIYTKAPTSSFNAVFKNAKQASEYILQNAHISTVPWDDAGAFLRFSVTFNAASLEDEITLMNTLKQRLLSLKLSFK